MGDNQLAQWPVDLRINQAGKEMVDLLGPMLETRLTLWKNKYRNSLPDNLLIYRDGVSEGQYKAALKEELEPLRNTCKVMYRGRTLPKITIIIVGKRHHTRFFKQEKEGGCTNLAFGTYVHLQFYFSSHLSFFRREKTTLHFNPVLTSSPPPSLPHRFEGKSIADCNKISALSTPESPKPATGISSCNHTTHSKAPRALLTTSSYSKRSSPKNSSALAPKYRTTCKS